MKTFSPSWLKWLALAALLQLNACGGGAGGTQPAPSPPTPPPAELTPRVDGDRFRVVPIASELQLDGANLDKVSAAAIGPEVLTLVSQSASRLVLRMPTQELAGALSFRMSTGQAIDSLVQITAYEPVSGLSFRPASAEPGSRIEVEGRGLQNLASVVAAEFPSDGRALDFQRGRWGFVLPPAWGAVPTLRLSINSRYQSQLPLGTLDVLKPVRVSSLQLTQNGTRLRLLVQGTGLAAAKDLWIGAEPGTQGTPVALELVQELALEAQLPAGTQGQIWARFSDRPAQRLGAFLRHEGVPVQLQAWEWVQRFARPEAELVQGIPAAVRVVMRVDPASGTHLLAARSLWLELLQADEPPFRLELATPSSWKINPDPYRLADGHFLALPPEAIRRGMRWQLWGSSDIGPVLLHQQEPRVLEPGKPKLVVVPLTINGVAAAVPSSADLQAAMQGIGPWRSTDLQLRIRSPLDLSLPVDASGAVQLAQLLSEVERLRRSEVPGDDSIYYGLFAHSLRTQERNAGLAYVNDLSSFGRLGAPLQLSAVGHDWPEKVLLDRLPVEPESSESRRSWALVMLHELGHVLGRQHASAPGVPGPTDPDFPTPGGRWGPEAVWQGAYFGSPTPVGDSQPPLDLMALGPGFSAYSWAAQARSLDAWRLRLAQQPAPAGAAADAWYLSARRHDGAWVLADPMPARRRLDASHTRAPQGRMDEAENLYFLLRYPDGRLLHLPAESVPVADGSIGEQIWVAKVDSNPVAVQLIDGRGQMLVERRHPKLRRLGR